MFKRTRIRTLLTAALVLLATLLTGVGVSGLLGIGTANDAHENTYQNIPTLIAIARQQQGLAGARMALDRAVADPSGPDADAALAAVQALIAESDRQWKAYRTSRLRMMRSALQQRSKPRATRSRRARLNR